MTFSDKPIWPVRVRNDAIDPKLPGTAGCWLYTDGCPLHGDRHSSIYPLALCRTRRPQLPNSFLTAKSKNCLIF